MTPLGATMLGAWLRRAGFLLPMAVGAVAIMAPATFVWMDHLPIPGARLAEADNSPLTVGLDTAFGVTRVFGMPLRTYRVQGDQFWVFAVRTESDSVNVKRLERGEAELDRPAAGPVLMERISVLRFDGESKLLKAVYLR